MSQRKIKIDGFAPPKHDLLAGVCAEIMQADYAGSRLFYECFNPTPRQREVYELIENSEAPKGHWLHVLLYGDTGGAKTWTALGYAIKCMLEYPGCKVLVVRETAGDLMLTTFGEVLRFFQRWGIRIVAQNKTLGHLQIENGSEIFFRSDKALVKPGKDKSDSLGSTEFSIVIFEEADSVSREVYRTISGRMRDKAGVKRKVVFAICNPPNERHWLYQLYNNPIRLQDPPHKRRWHSIQMLAKDNPHLEEGYNAAKEDDWSDDPSFLRRMAHGETGPDTKGIPYFKRSFSFQRHVSKLDLKNNPNPNYPIWRGWDFGYNWPALVVLQDLEDRGQIRVLHSVIEQDMSTWDMLNKWVPMLHKMYPNYKFLDACDPAGKQKQSALGLTDIQVMHSFGVYPQYKKSRIEYGLNIIDEVLRKNAYQDNPALILDPTAKDLIDALWTGYCVKQDNVTGILEIQKDGIYDHIMDAFRYIMIMIRNPGQTYQAWENPRAEWEPWMTKQQSGAFLAGDAGLVSRMRTLGVGPQGATYARGASRRRY